MKVKVSAPTRVDFAGGTLDLYPLYLFLNGGLTINAGITIYSHVKIETRPDKEIHIKSRDLQEESTYDSIESIDLRGPTSFIQRAIKSYCPGTGINVTTMNEAPIGSGLGASSSLLMALSAALLSINGEKTDIGEMIRRGAAIEAGHLGIPTGQQDYYGAVLGRVHALHFSDRGCLPEEMSVDDRFLDQLNRSLVVSYTGISHYSGANNWDMLKMAIDRVGKTYENLLKIKQITYDLYRAFKEKDLEKAAFCVDREWQARKELAPGITNDFIDGIIEKARKSGAWGSKLCGAGGGGCMVTLSPPDKKGQVIDALNQAGACILNASIDRRGMSVEVE